MREILFRGKWIDNGEWVEGYYAKQSNHACFARELKYQHFIFKNVCLDFNLGGLQEFEVYPETIGQYTGLTDKNGRKIFEGDIIHLEYIRNPRGIEGTEAVIFQDCKFGILWGSYREFVTLTGFVNTTLEVIGNIHDNPELMKGEQG